MNKNNLSFCLLIFSLFNPIHAVTWKQFDSKFKELPIYQEIFKPKLGQFEVAQYPEMKFLIESLLNQYKETDVLLQIYNIDGKDLDKLILFLSVTLVSLKKKIIKENLESELSINLALTFPLNPKQIIFLNQKAISCLDLNKAVNFANDIYSILRVICGFYCEATINNFACIIIQTMISNALAKL